MNSIKLSLGATKKGGSIKIMSINFKFKEYLLKEPTQPKAYVDG